MPRRPEVPEKAQKTHRSQTKKLETEKMSPVETRKGSEEARELRRATETHTEEARNPNKTRN